MRRTSRKQLLAGTLAASATAALSLGIVASSAPADSAKQGIPATAKIKMTFDQGPPLFEGPDSVEPGQDLKIINKTKPKDIGPHLFTLIDPEFRPDSRKEYKACGRLELQVCVNIAKAHRLSKQFVVRKPSVDKGAEGWDTSFTDEVKGDSWYTEQKNDSEKRVVSPEVAGSTLSYFCLVHPDTMQGQIQVGALPR